MNASSASAISVVIADDHAAIRAGLQRIVESDPELAVAAQAQDGVSTIAALNDTPCDVLLLDFVMPPPCGLDLIAQIRDRWPATAILVVSVLIDVMIVKSALGAGARGYVAKDSDPEVLLAAMHQLARGGGRFVDPALGRAAAFAAVAQESENSEAKTSNR